MLAHSSPPVNERSFFIKMPEEPGIPKDIMQQSCATWHETGKAMAVFIFSPDVSDEFTRKEAAATVAVNEGKKGSIRVSLQITSGAREADLYC